MFVKMKGHSFFKGKIITTLQKFIINEILESSSSEHMGNFNQTWHRAYLDDGNSSLFKLNEGP